jgi:hypothetical protein
MTSTRTDHLLMLHPISDPSPCRDAEHYSDELEEELEDAMQQDFNLEAQDGSLTEIAKTMVKLYQECLQGASPYLEHLRATAQSGAAKSQKVSSQA